jgi:hypothetical protein
MSTIQKLIIVGLGMLTGLVCLVAVVMLFNLMSPASSLTPLPSATPLPTSTPLPTPTPQIPTPTPDVGDEYGAISICKKFVKDRLIAPRDAKWPGLFDEGPTVTQIGPATWRVESWVDASNRLGVHIRTQYVCDVRYLGGDKWRLEALDLQD